jgi:hypothetical protein
MRPSLVSFLIMLAVSLAAPTLEADTARYQALGLGAAGTLILDTREGHLWRCLVMDGFNLIYEGQLRPGERWGEALFSPDLERDLSESSEEKAVRTED